MTFPYLKKNKNLYLVFTFIAILLLSVLLYIAAHWEFKNTDGKKNNLNSEVIPEKFIINFETDYLILENSKGGISTEHALSGKHSTVMAERNAYSAAIVFDLDNIASANTGSVKIGAWFLPVKTKMNVLLVLSVFDEDMQTQLYWDALQVNRDNVTAGEWFYASRQFTIPDSLMNQGNKVRIYGCNYLGDGHIVYIDDIEISFQNGDAQTRLKRSKLIDYEGISGDGITTRVAYNSQKSASAAGKNTYTAPTMIPLADFDLTQVDRVNFRFYYLSEKAQMDYVLVFAVKDKNNNDVFWYGYLLGKTNSPVKKWIKEQDSFEIPPEVCSPGNTLCIYGWNRNNNSVYVDDILVIMKNTDDIKLGNNALCDLTVDSVFKPAINTPPYPCSYGTYVMGKVLPEKGIIKKYNYISNIRLLNQQHEQVVAGNSPNTLSIFYAVKEGLFSKPVIFSEKVNENALMIPIDWDNNKKDEICFIDNSGRKIICFSLNNDAYQISGTKLWEKQFESFDGFSTTTWGACISTTGANKPAILVLQGTKFGCIYPSEKREPVFITEKNNFPSISKFYCYDVLPEIAGSEIFAIYGEETKMVYRIFSVSLQKGAIRITQVAQTPEILEDHYLLNARADYISIGSHKNNSGKVLVLDRSWRFDLKQINVDKKMYTIEKSIDFKGFPDGLNPKYYTNNSIVCGNYTGDETPEIMCFSFIDVSSANLTQSTTHDKEMMKSKVEIYAF
ncbi:MAG: hypothetical protein KBB11_02600 [Bacteroidales bacterium]|nr:hypothetical protein [Bacteroidales bacterium]HQP03393.1 hypothetical protein [Bacteroidales bacterium]